MKKFILLSVLLLLQTGMFASNNRRPVWHNYNEPVEINVRGVKFYVFANGIFDFNTHPNNTYRSKRFHNRHSYPSVEYGVRIERNRYGDIRRVGNVFINYNRHRQVSRIGNIFISYNHSGFFKKIGRMRIRHEAGGYLIYRRSYNTCALPFSWSYSSTFYGPSTSYYGYNNYDDYWDNDTYEYEDEYDDGYNSGYDYGYGGNDNYYFRGSKKKKTSKHRVSKSSKKRKAKIRGRRR